MAIGSNTLGLLFKIGVDAKDAVSSVDALKGSLTSFVQGAGEGIKAGLKDVFQSADEGAKKLSASFQATGQSARGLSSGAIEASRSLRELSSGDIGSGITNLGRSFLNLGPALGTVVALLGTAAIAAYAAVKSFQAITSAAAEIGTRSKDAFDELQKNATAAGTPITDVQRNLSQGIVGALDLVKGASDGFMAKVIEKSGPELIQLLKDISKFLVDMQPLAEKIGNLLSQAFIIASASLRTFRDLLKETTEEERNKPISGPHGLIGDLLFGTSPPGANDPIFEKNKSAFKFLTDDYKKNLDAVKKDIGNLVVGPAAFDPDKQKKARKDLTDAALEQAKAENALTLVKQDAAIADKQINEDQAKGLITQEEGAQRRLAVLAEVQKAEKAVLDARQKAAETDPTLLANQRAKQLNDIDTQRAVLRTQAAEAQREEDDKTIASDQKLHDAFAAHFAKLKQEWVTYAEFIHKTTDQIVEDLARQAQAVPGGAGQGPIPGAPPQIPLPAPPTGFFDDLSKVLSQSQDQFQTWGQAVGTVLLQVAQATEQVFATFILTGQASGQIFKKLAADIIASVAVQSIVKAIFEVAEGFAALAQIPFDPTAGYRASMHFAAARTYALVGAVAAVTGLAIGAAGGLGGGGGASAAAGGGGFGGTPQAPGTVTINQGVSSGTLGITLLSSINNHLSNLSTASPGDVVTRGAEQNPMVIGQANNEAARRDGTVSREFLQISGLRPA